MSRVFRSRHSWAACASAARPSAVGTYPTTTVMAILLIDARGPTVPDVARPGAGGDPPRPEGQRALALRTWRDRTATGGCAAAAGSATGVCTAPRAWCC